MFITAAIAASADTPEGGGMFPPFDSTHFASQLFWLALTFGFFYWFISRVASPRIGDILENRQVRIAQDIDMARDLQSQADEAHAAYEQDLAEARSTAGDIALKARNKAKADAEAERHKVQTDLSEKLDQAEARIGTIRDAAMAEVGSIASGTAGAIVEQLMGTSVTKADLAKAIDAAGR